MWNKKLPLCSCGPSYRITVSDVRGLGLKLRGAATSSDLTAGMGHDDVNEKLRTERNGIRENLLVNARIDVEWAF